MSEKVEERWGVSVGEWILLGSRQRVEAHRPGHLDELALTGTLTGIAQRDPKALATLQAIGRLEPLVGALNDSLQANDPVDLTYAKVLGSEGWDTIFVELTGQCNEACTHCYAESSPEQREQLSLDEVLGVIRQAQTLGFRRLQLTGGDPLVSKTYLEAARLAHELGFPQIEVFTNGLALSESVADQLARYDVTFSFSFYSHEPSVHDAITRTPGSQVRTLAAMKRVLDRGLTLRVGIISTETNRTDVVQTWRLLRAVGVPIECIGVDQEREVGRGAFKDAESALPRHLWLTEEAAPQAAQDTAPSPPALSAHGGMSGRGKLCISYSATVYPCIFSRDKPLGNIREASLSEILNQKLRLRASGKNALPMIADAEARLTCSDCRARDRLLAQLETCPAK